MHAAVPSDGPGAARSLEAQVLPRVGPSECGEVRVHGGDGVWAEVVAIDRGSALVVAAFSGAGRANPLTRQARFTHAGDCSQERRVAPGTGRGR
jgi:hypothetical protein